MSEVDASAADDLEVEYIVVAVVLDMVANEDVVEGAMVITQTNSLSGTYHLYQKLVYNLLTNGDSSACNKE